MSVGSILASALQSSQVALRPTEFTPPIPGQPPGGIPTTSFRQTLTDQILQQADVLLHPAGAASAPRGDNPATDLLDELQHVQARAADATHRVISGDGASLHTAMIAMEEASVSFQMIVEMRNKIVESLQELMRMQI